VVPLYLIMQRKHALKLLENKVSFEYWN